MPHDAQIGIVGAGPAGARAAELLARAGADVVLWDPRAPWEKPCGGGLTAGLFRHVPELKGVLPLARRIDAVRLELDNGTGTTIPLQNPVHVLSRKTLGRWQLERAVSSGASHVRERVRDAERVPEGGWRITLSDGSHARVERLVGADGAASRVRSVVAPGLDIMRVPTRIALVSEEGTDNGVLGLRFWPGIRGYVWDFARPRHRCIGIGIDPGIMDRRSMDEEVDTYWAFRGRTDDLAADRAGAVIGTVHDPEGPDFSRIGGPDYALLGDAAGLADPTTGEGIQNAIRSAEALGEVFAREGTFTSYGRELRTILHRELQVSRLARRILYSRPVANTLLRAATRGGLVGAFLEAIANGFNEHDPAILGGWIQALRRPGAA